VLGKIIQNNTLEESSYSVEKAIDKLIVSFKYARVDKIELTKLITQLQSLEGVLEVTWNT
ncbi:MAG TPA: hypothetical protein VGI82_12465, partial [Chitinophagaceae bacterium]